tara:strand:+ start:1931 stop:2647 length:717 start_codon:yes stop_codon:yes gene_type:complete
MAEITYDPIDPQESFTTDSLNNRFSAGPNSLQTAINDLEIDALSPGTFNEAHLPSLVLFRGEMGQSAVANAYTYATTPYPADWDVINSNGSAGTGADLDLSLGATYNLSTGQAQGVFVMADLYVGKIIRTASGATATPTDGVGFRIQIYNGSSWVTINRTQRFVACAVFGGNAFGFSKEQDVKVPIRTLIKASDIAANTISRVRVQITVVSDPGADATTTVSLKACYLSAIVLQSTVV